MSITPSHPLAGVYKRRELLNIKAKDIARRIGVTTDYYSRIERGERRCYVDRAKAIAKMLGCSTDDLEHEPTVEEQVAALHRHHEHLVNDLNKPAPPPQRDVYAEQEEYLRSIGQGNYPPRPNDNVGDNAGTVVGVNAAQSDTNTNTNTGIDPLEHQRLLDEWDNIDWNSEPNYGVDNS